MNDSDLLSSMMAAVQREREAITCVLHHLREVQRRRLFSKLKYKSLFDYAVKHLQYSEREAYARIQAMRLLKELPAIESKIHAGSLSLTNVTLAQSFFRKRAMSVTEKTEFLANLENKSTRQAEKIVAQLSQEPARPDSVRPLANDFVELRFAAPDRLMNKLERVRGKIAHTHPHSTLADLIEYLCDRELEKKPVRHSTSAPKKTRVITRRMKAEVAQDHCANCGSEHALQYDHIVPFAKGGETAAENLRVLCRSCNQRAAIENFGLQKMDRYLNKV